MMLTREQFAAAVPRVNVDMWFCPVNDTLTEFAIDTPTDIAAFLATCAHESGDFTRLVENLNYSAQGLANTWPTRYSSTGRSGDAPNALANRLARNPEAIANNAYANRLGNGDEASGDGWAYRGRGLIQLTGLANYAAATSGLRVNYVARPSLVEQAPDAVRTAGFWWSTNNASRYGAAGDILAVSRLVNLGNAGSKAMPIGWTDRNQRYDLALASITV